MNWKPLVRSYLVRINQILNDKDGEYNEEYSLTRRLTSTAQQHMHLRKMCEQLLEEESPVDEEYSLGFIQGILWLQGVYSIEELKAHALAAKASPEEAVVSSVDALPDDVPF